MLDKTQTRLAMIIINGRAAAVFGASHGLVILFSFRISVGMVLLLDCRATRYFQIVANINMWSRNK